MYYTVTVGYETDTVGKDGKPKIKKEKYIVQAESVEEASIVIAEYSSGDMRSSETISIVNTQIECVIDEKNAPDYYKKSKK